MANDNHKKRHYPPAYYRYRKEHPTISVALTKELKTFVDHQMPPGMSYSQFVKKLVSQAYDLSKAKDEGHREGYTEAMAKAEAKFKKEVEKYRKLSLGMCSCNKPLVFHLDNPEDMRILNQVVSDSGLTHQGCKAKSRVIRLDPPSTSKGRK